MNVQNQPEDHPARTRRQVVRLFIAMIVLVILLLSVGWTIKSASSTSFAKENLPQSSFNTPSATRAISSSATAQATSTRQPTATNSQTATLSATNTPTASRTPIPTSTPQTIIEVNRDLTKLYTGPGTSYEVIEILNTAEKVSLIGRASDNSWLYVKTTAGSEGWIKPINVDLAEISLDAYNVQTPSVRKEVKVLADPAYLRTGPAAYYVKVGPVSFGDLLTVLGRSDDFKWLFVSAPGGQQGWISTESIDTYAINFYNDFFPVNTPPPTETATPVILKDVEGHWIDVDLSEQMVRAYDGTQLVKSFLVSTGVYQFPTQTGRFHVYAKFVSGLMHGTDYYLPDVPYIMYYDGDFSLHGTYWHHNFGTPMSHGCINMDIPDSEWMFDFAPIGTIVNIHH